MTEVKKTLLHLNRASKRYVSLITVSTEKYVRTHQKQKKKQNYSNILKYDTMQTLLTKRVEQKTFFWTIIKIVFDFWFKNPVENSFNIFNY